MRGHVKFALAAILAAIAGCGGNAGQLSYSEHRNFYSPQLVRYVSQKGYFPVAMYGAPFGENGNAQIAQSLALPSFYKSVPFKMISSLESREYGRLVLIIDAKRVANGDRVCSNPGDLPLAADDNKNIRIQASFCYQDEMVAQTVLSAPRPTSPSDPDFQQALTYMTEYLFRTQVSDGAECASSSGPC